MLMTLPRSDLCSTRSPTRWKSSWATAATIPLLDTPIHPQNARFEQITITDPAHPLYGRSFPLISISGSQHGTGHAYVDDCGRAVMRIPIRATSLHPAPLDLPTSKLSPGHPGPKPRPVREAWFLRTGFLSKG